MLAHLEPATRHRLLATLDLKRFTATTITDAAALDRELDLGKARGYAISVEEQTQGINSVGNDALDAVQDKPPKLFPDRPLPVPDESSPQSPDKPDQP